MSHHFLRSPSPDTLAYVLLMLTVLMSGNAVRAQRVLADGQQHELQFDVPVDRSSWVAQRQFPQLHTNPVNAIVNDEPVRASRTSTLWCADAVRLLWRNRQRFISPSEQPAAREAYT